MGTVDLVDIEDLAWRIVEKAFAGKVDKGGAPYIGHMKRIIKLLYPIESGAQEIPDEELNCIAILHDLIEDCPEWNINSISAIFPIRVIDALIVLTKLKNESYDKYITRVMTNKDAVRVKLCDLKDNMDITRLKTIEPEDANRLRKYLDAYKLIMKDNKGK